MGPAVRDLSRELHFRFLGLAKYLRSRQKVEFSEFPALSCVLQSGGLVANMRLGQFCAPAFRVRLEQDELVCVNFKCHILHSNAKIVIFIKLEQGNVGKNTILLFLLLLTTQSMRVFVYLILRTQQKKVRRCRVKMKQKKQKLSCAQP